MAWGLCRDCKWWQIEPGAAIEPATVGMCIEEQLQPFVLRISATGGCNVFVDGEPARAKGSSDAPPTAKPTR